MKRLTDDEKQFLEAYRQASDAIREAASGMLERSARRQIKEKRERRERLSREEICIETARLGWRGVVL